MPEHAWHIWVVVNKASWGSVWCLRSNQGTVTGGCGRTESITEMLHISALYCLHDLWVTAEKLVLQPAALPLTSVCMSFSFHTFGYRRYCSLLCVGIFTFLIFNAVYHCLQNHRCLICSLLLKNSRLLCYFLSLFLAPKPSHFWKV